MAIEKTKEKDPLAVLYVRGISREVASHINAEAKLRGWTLATLLEAMYEAWPDRRIE